MFPLNMVIFHSFLYVYQRVTNYFNYHGSTMAQLIPKRPKKKSVVLLQPKVLPQAVLCSVAGQRVRLHVVQKRNDLHLLSWCENLLIIRASNGT